MDRPPLRLASELSRAFLLRNGVCPERWGEEGALVLASIAEPSPDVLADMDACYGAPLQVKRVSVTELEALVERLSAGADRPDGETPQTSGGSCVTDVRDLIHEAPVVRYVNLLLQDALKVRASDIHLESAEGGPTVRFRVDGRLVPGLAPLVGLHDAVVSRIKLLAELDIAERRRPQDGRLRIRVEAGEIDLRISTVPTLHGESVVLRLLTEGSRPVSLNDLGLAEADANYLCSVVGRAQGLVLITGPTGSGKTTSLYALTRLRALGAEKVMTVEDPVEYQLHDVTQTPVHRATGVTFASTLRSLLRQDPDVILVGETRDAETAQIAVQAALTGHLVLTSLHTNDAPSAIPRLLDLGVPPFLLTATISVVMAQRLVRRTCAGCAQPRAATSEERRVLGPSCQTVVQGVGCPECRGSGFAGRIGLFEVLRIDDEVRRVIGAGAALQDLREAARTAGWIPMWDDAVAKVRAGHTTLAEASNALAG